MNGGVNFQNLMNRVYNVLEMERRAEARLNNLIPMCENYDSKVAILNAHSTTRGHVREVERVIKTITGVEAPKTRLDDDMRIVGTFLEGLQDVLELLENVLVEVLNIIVQTGIELIRTLFQSIRDALNLIIETLRALLQTILGNNP